MTTPTTSNGGIQLEKTTKIKTSLGFIVTMISLTGMVVGSFTMTMYKLNGKLEEEVFDKYLNRQELSDQRRSIKDSLNLILMEKIAKKLGITNGGNGDGGK